MDWVRIHQGLADETRVRMVHLLTLGPLCVRHFQAILGAPQVKVSKHLSYLRLHGLVECERRGNSMVYRLPANPGVFLEAELRCLVECARDLPVMQQDLTARGLVAEEMQRLLQPAARPVKRRAPTEPALADPAVAPAVGLGPYGASDYID